MRVYDFSGCVWSKDVENRLAPACDKFMSVEELRQAIENREMSLFSVSENGEEVCNFVLRLDGEEDQKEMVVVVGGGNLKGDSLFKICTPYIEEIARKCNAQWIRGHVNSKAKALLMERAGYIQEEIIFRKEVGHGRQIQ